MTGQGTHLYGANGLAESHELREILLCSRMRKPHADGSVGQCYICAATRCRHPGGAGAAAKLQYSQVLQGYARTPRMMHQPPGQQNACIPHGTSRPACTAVVSAVRCALHAWADVRPKDCMPECRQLCFTSS
jgi:hypothetical protein